MKKLVYIILLLVTTVGFSQSNPITYQAVIYLPSGQNAPGVDVTNLPMTNKNICLQFSFIDANNRVEYQEEIKVKTDEFGMVNITIGNGEQSGGYASSYDAIVWNALTQKNLQVALDATGLCNQFEVLSNEPIASVPFANAAITAGNVSGIVALVNGGTGATTAAGARANLGIGNVENTADLNKPMSTATKTYVDTAITGATIADASTTSKGKIQLAGDLAGTAGAPTVPGLALKENAENKSTTTTLGTSNVLFPTQNAVKTYVDTAIAGATIVDADANTKGKIQLTGDLGGTASAPTVPGLALKLDASLAGVPNGLATLNSAGIIPANQLPPISVASTNVVANQAQMLALSNATVGSIAVRTDVNKNYILSVAGPSVLANWIELLTPGAPVQSVNGLTGAIQLAKSDINLANVDNTSDAAKPVSTATQNALNLKLNTNQVGVPNGTASLNALGKIPTSQIPSISFSSVKVLGSQAEMLALGNAVVGSVVIRTDVNKNFVLAQSDPGILANWVELLTPAPPVQSVNGYDGNVSLTKSDVGLSNADNTRDIDKPVSTATQTALDLKANLASPTFTGTVGGITKSMVGLANVDNTTDLNKPVSTATQSALDLKANLASPTFSGTVSGITKAMVGLGNVDNTTDVAKPISTATQSALDLKANAADVTTSLALKEDVANKSTTVTLGNSDLFYPSQKAVKTYVDTAIAGATIVDADGTTKGKLKLAGDLAGTADLPEVAAGAITTAKLAANAVTTAKITDANVTTAKLADDAVTTVKITDANVTTAKLAANAVTTAKLADDAVETAKIKAGAVTDAKLDKANIPLSGFGAAAANVALGANKLTGVADPTLAQDAATKNYVDVAIAGATIADANGSTKGKLKLAGDLAGTADLPEVAAGAISTAKLATNAVTTAKITDANVTDAKLDKANIPLSGFGAATADVALGAYKLTGVADPTAAQDAATKNYVDTAISGSSTTAVPYTGATGSVNLGSYDIYAKSAKFIGDIYTIPTSQVGSTSPYDNNNYKNNNGLVLHTYNQSGFPSLVSFVATGSVNGNYRSSINFLTRPTGTTAIPLERLRITAEGLVGIGTTAPTATLDVVGSGKFSTDVSVGGTITSGIWSGTEIAIAKGGTGATTAAAALTNLGAEPTANKSTAVDLGNSAPSDDLFPSQKAVKAYVDSSVSSGAPDATTTTAGKIKLAGDLTGTAALPEVAAGAISTAKLAANAVTTVKIADASVTKAKLADDAVETAKIKDLNVTVDKLAANAVTTAKILDGTILVGDLADDAVETLKIKDANVTTAKLADAAVETAKIKDAAVETAKIKDANVTAAKLAADAVETAKIKDANVTNAKLDKANIPLSGFGAAAADVALGANKLTGVADPTLAQDAATKNYVDTATSGITTLADGKIYLGNASNVATEVTPSGDVTMTNAGVTAIGAGKVVVGMLATDAVETAKIKDANVTTAKLADAAVTTAKITDANVTAAKLAADAVETAKIKDAAVETAKIKDANVTYAKIQNVATGKVLGRVSANAGVVEEIATTGTGDVVRATSPTLVTPTLGVATATSVNGLTPTALATGFTIAGGSTTSKTLTVSGDATVSGTTSGTNTGDQTITLTGDVTGSGTGSFAATIGTGKVTTATIAADAVTSAKIADATIVVGDLAADAVETAKIKDENVTYAKIQNVATGKVLGRVSANAGVVEEIATTGTGDVVRATSPTLVTPVLGAATGTSLSVSGQLTSTVATGTAPLVVTSTTPVANLSIGGTAVTATNVAGGTIGSVPYQSAAGTTALLAGNTTATAKYLTSTGNGTTAAAPTWTTISAVPYTGATGAVDLGAYDLKVNGLTIGKGPGNTSYNFNSVALGVNALAAQSSNGGNNVAIGYDALKASTTGSESIAIGAYTLDAQTTGGSNIAIGSQALSALTNSFSNVAIGAGALSKVTSANSNIGIGSSSGSNLTTGEANIMIGPSAGLYYGSGSDANTTGNNSIFIGFSTRPAANNETNEVVIAGTPLSGKNIGQGSNTTTLGNEYTTKAVIYGSTSLSNLPSVSATGAGGNFTIEAQDGFTNSNGGALNLIAGNGDGTGNGGNINLTPGTTGTGTAGKVYVNGGDMVVNGLTVGKGKSAISTNTAIGTSALNANTTGNNTTAIGYNSLAANTTGSNNTGLGAGSMALNTTGKYNTALGYNALSTNVSADQNTAVGYEALKVNTVNANSAFGFGVLTANTTGNVNSGFGNLALTSNTTGANNTAFGGMALRNLVIGSDNTAIGTSAGINATGSQNIFIGSSAGISTTSVSNNIFLGAKAGQYYGTLSNTNNTTGDGNVMIGTDVRPLADGQTNQIVIAGYTGSGTGMTGKGSNTTTIGNSATTDTYINGNLNLTGQIKLTNAVLSKSATYAFLTTDNANLLVFTGSTAGQTITLPSAVTVGAGREITIKNIASVSVSIGAAAGNLISDSTTTGATSLAIGIEPSNNWIKAISDGTNWIILRALF